MVQGIEGIDFEDKAIAFNDRKRLAEICVELRCSSEPDSHGNNVLNRSIERFVNDIGLTASVGNRACPEHDRSSRRIAIADAWHGAADDRRSTRHSFPGDLDRVDPIRRLEAASGATQAVMLAAATRDRKSTRLNSSHRCISYAVFCLKKK